MIFARPREVSFNIPCQSILYIDLRLSAATLTDDSVLRSVLALSTCRCRRRLFKRENT